MSADKDDNNVIQVNFANPPVSDEDFEYAILLLVDFVNYQAEEGKFILNEFLRDLSEKPDKKHDRQVVLNNLDSVKATIANIQASVNAWDRVRKK